MAFPHLTFTDEGRSLQVKAMNGDSIIFTKVALGNGEAPSDISALTQLNNQLYICGIAEFENHNTYATIHWFLDSQSVQSEFDWTEYGLFAKDSNNNEVLYAYAYDNNPQTIPSGDASSITQLESDLNIALGDAENVSAVIGEYSAYASKEVVNEHINNNSNPHAVTKEQVGLGNVENVSTDNATPSFTASNSLQELFSGERLSVLFGKLKIAVKALIDHIANTNNPHKITLEKIGAAASSHTHSVVDINSGILSEKRGGTGYDSLTVMLHALGLTDLRLKSHRHTPTGGNYIFSNKMYITWDKVSVNADANYIGETSVDYGANFFAAPPMVFATINTGSINRHCAVKDVSRSGYTIVLQNNTNSANTNIVYCLVIGYLTKDIN